LKQKLKARKKQLKVERGGGSPRKRRVFVVSFHGDIRGSAVASLREEVTAILTVAEAGDEVIVRLESGGGLVHAYGLAASQLLRIKAKGLRLIVAVDKVAASGGYMMACVADRVLAAPFAVVGSIGVVSQIPNFHRLLQKNDIDFEQFTAGEYKRTVTVFGENTDAGREKFRAEIEDTHRLFKEFVSEHRKGLDMVQVATGEHWFGARALELNLVDELRTSDDYLLEASNTADLYEVSFAAKKHLAARLMGMALQRIKDRLLF
jgi:serine protease SohB